MSCCNKKSVLVFIEDDTLIREKGIYAPFQILLLYFQHQHLPGVTGTTPTAQTTEWPLCICLSGDGTTLQMSVNDS